jgi:tetratricopeptide (TPR) repeat protein/SOS response regulatory protein OraA/RecX
MRSFLISALLIINLFPLAGQAQRDSSRNDFANAESWFLFEEYNEAEFIYQKLLRQFPEDDNLKYKIGICLLNDPYRKDQSIRYLLDASKNINPEYKEGSFKEQTAPPDVLYYLGNAYLVNERIDQAIDAFHRFQDIMDPAIYDEELVQAQIQACENARKLMAMPVDIDLYPVSQEVNTRYAETRPVISGDGNRMAFVTEQPFFDEALFIEKVDGQWTLPMSITSMLGFDEDIYPCALNYDGTEMLLYYDDDHIGNLYSSRYNDGFWLPAEKLGENISTKYWESHGSFSKDGQTLYFTSNRKGTYGGLDIYKSKRQPDGKWGEPENLGSTINTRYNEETPFITEDGQTLYFSSYGHYNMGGYDIFCSKKNKDGSWGTPVNLGYPINTTDDDLFFLPVNNGFGGYQSRIEKDTRGRRDLYFMDIYSANNPRMYLVTGFVRTEDSGMDLTTLHMLVIDPETGDTLKYSIPIEEDGSFSLNLTQGNYMLHFKGEGYEELIRPLSITPASDKQGITIDEVIQLAQIRKEPLIFEGEESMIQVKDTVFEAEAGKTLSIPLRLEKGAALVVRVYQDSLLVSVDTLQVEKRRTELEVIPLPGESRIELEMTDEDGNIHRREIYVTGTVPVTSPGEQKTKQAAEIPPSLAGSPVGLLLLDLRENSEGGLKEYLMQLDLEKEGIDTPAELFEHLYLEAERGTFDPGEVDRLLAETLLDGEEEPGNLLKLLLVNADGPLQDHLAGMDLQQNGIRSPEELLRSLEEDAGQNGYTMQDVRKAMLKSLETDPAILLLMDLRDESEGKLKDYLLQIDPGKEAIGTPGALFERLYSEADSQGYGKEEVDMLLAGELSGGNAALLHRRLFEQSEGPLRTYLEGLDLEKEGIQTAEDLLKHLGEVADQQGFTMDEVRRAMILALDNPLEVEQVYEDLLLTADEAVREILQGIDLRRDGILTVEDLITSIYHALAEKGFSKREIREILSQMFPAYGDHIDTLLEGKGHGNGLTAGIILGVAGILLLLIILWFRRRKKE